MHVSNEDSKNDPRVGEALHSFARHRKIEPDRLTQLMRESESFREICADYEECCVRLLGLAQKAGTTGRQVRDYEEMRDQLEQDLLRCLKGPAACRTNGRRAEQGRTE